MVFCIWPGWASNSNTFWVLLRSTTQMISYSVSLSLIFLCVIFTLGLLIFGNCLLNVRILFYALLPIAILFYLISALARNKLTFDLPVNQGGCWIPDPNSLVSVCLFLFGHEYTNILTISTLFYCSSSVYLWLLVFFIGLGGFFWNVFVWSTSYSRLVSHSYYHISSFTTSFSGSNYFNYLIFLFDRDTILRDSLMVGKKKEVRRWPNG
jgi:NADH:ubiquinone oxidoreductase subunit H